MAVHHVFKPILPDLSIVVLRGTSTSRGYHETYFEVVSHHPINAEGWANLDAGGFLGMGQAYSVLTTETFESSVPAVPVDSLTGERLGPEHARTDLSPYVYTYHRYTVRRICDSGD